MGHRTDPSGNEAPAVLSDPLLTGGQMPRPVGDPFGVTTPLHRPQGDDCLRAENSRSPWPGLWYSVPFSMGPCTALSWGRASSRVPAMRPHGASVGRKDRHCTICQALGRTSPWHCNPTGGSGCCWLKIPKLRPVPLHSFTRYTMDTLPQHFGGDTRTNTARLAFRSLEPVHTSPLWDASPQNPTAVLGGRFPLPLP